MAPQLFRTSGELSEDCHLCRPWHLAVFPALTGFGSAQILTSYRGAVVPHLGGDIDRGSTRGPSLLRVVGDNNHVQDYVI